MSNNLVDFSDIESTLSDEEEDQVVTPVQRNAPLPAVQPTRSHSRVRRRVFSAPNNQKFKNITMRSKYYIPILNWLPQYDFKKFLGDFSAAVTLSCLLVPQSMSYASALAGIDPIGGLLVSFPSLPFHIYPLSLPTFPVLCHTHHHILLSWFLPYALSRT
jgi:hypothetical protein